MLSCTMRYTASSSSGDQAQILGLQIERDLGLRGRLHFGAQLRDSVSQLHALERVRPQCRTERRTSFMPSRAVDAMRSICFFAILGEISSICMQASAPAVMPVSA